MKPISTLKSLAAGSLLLISIFTACKKDPVPEPGHQSYPNTSYLDSEFNYRPMPGVDVSKIKAMPGDKH